jgi:site-specific DNA-methyltransferase (adenine-specific)
LELKGDTLMSKITSSHECVNDCSFEKEMIEPQNRNKLVYIKEGIALYHADYIDIISKFPDNYVDMIFADPPYNLSNGGITCQAGKRVSVNKGKWDKSKGFQSDVDFHERWIAECCRILKPSGTIWISGTNHSIYQCGYILQKLGFYILNDIAWFKPNAAPNLACTTFAHSHETLLWAKKDKKSKHIFNYEIMKNGMFLEDKMKVPNKQMRSVWSISTPPKIEKVFGKHPTQKPLTLLKRIVQASTAENSIILDPFNGGGTTGVAVKMMGNRKYIGIELEIDYINLTIKRLENINKQVTIYDNF